MGPPGGGRTFVTPRFLRHMNLISLTNFDEDTLKLIFGTILTWYMKKSNFNQDLLKFEPKLIFGTLMSIHYSFSMHSPLHCDEYLVSFFFWN